ncbi:MAG: efflux RND transporter permease subunit [Sumerlaeia bacterium]
MTKFAVHAPVKVTMIFIAVLLLGMISLKRLPTSLFPDIRAPKVTTTIRTTGLSPTEIERRINEPLERQMYTIRGVKDVKTIARADQAVVITEFNWDTPLDFAFLDVKKAVSDLQRQRSQDIESASVLRYDPNAAPVMVIGLSIDPASLPEGAQPATLEDLRRLADQTLRPRFERIQGVANVVIGGGEEREARVALDESLLLAYDIDLARVVSALQAENVNATGGYIQEGTRRYLLKAIGEFEELEEVGDVVVTRQGEAAILLRDVAEITFAPKDPEGIVYVNGQPGIGMFFYREAEGNTVAVSEQIKAEMRALQGFATFEEKAKRDGGGPAGDGGPGGGGGGPKFGGPPQVESNILPPGAVLTIASDQSNFIRAAITEVRNNAIVGGLLAVVVILIFLRFSIRTTLIIATAIPVSIIATFIPMYFQGLTLNLMTLGGLALGTGLLVDNAIVVLENIFRMRQQGTEPKAAAQHGAGQVAGAIVASTLTTIVVFLPVIYVKGVAGLLFKEQALTVLYSLLASLLVALMLIPMLAARMLTKLPRGMRFDDAAEAAAAPRTLYTRALGLAVRLRWLVMAGAAALLVVSLGLLTTIPQEFLPHTEQRQIGLRLVLPNGAPIEATDQVTQTVLGQVGLFGPALQTTFARVGENEGEPAADTEDPDGPNTADLFITMVPWDDKPTTATREAGLAGYRPSDLIAELKPRLEAIPEVKAEFQLQQGSVFELIGSSSAPLLIEISGEDIRTLTRLAEEAKSRLEQTPGLLNVRTNILQGSPEVFVTLDPAQMARLGLDVQSVAATLRRRLDGEVAGQIKREAGDVDLRVEVDYGNESLETIGDIVLKTPSGAAVPLRNIASFRVERGPREIVRQGQSRVALVMADLSEGVLLSQAITEARAALDPMRRPIGYSLRFTGEEEQRAEAFGKLAFALILSILLVYMVMASIFESFIQPFLIMLTVPLAGIGVVAAFILTGTSINVMAIIGVVMLGGIVVNNAIVLLDRVNQVRAARPDLPPRESLLMGCQERLRPVLMTTATTLLGLLPLALGIGEGAELRQAMAIAVLGGLASSTVLTLLVIPVAQSFLDSVVGVIRGWRGGREAAGAPLAATR